MKLQKKSLDHEQDCSDQNAALKLHFMQGAMASHLPRTKFPCSNAWVRVANFLAGEASSAGIWTCHNPCSQRLSHVSLRTCHQLSSAIPIMPAMTSNTWECLLACAQSGAPCGTRLRTADPSRCSNPVCGMASWCRLYLCPSSSVQLYFVSWSLQSLYY